MEPKFTKDLYYMLPYRPQMTPEAEQACDWTYVSRSACNPNRISVFKLNALKALANKYACPATALEFLLDLPYDEFDPELAKILPQSFRAKKGTYLKIGTLFSTVFSDLYFSPDQISQRASEFADQLRLRNPANSSTLLKESPTPSEVYTMGSDFCSCMRNQSKDWFELYDDLPGTSILYLPNPNDEREIWGRALLHRGILAVQDPVEEAATKLAKPIDVMDRIYFRDNDVLAQFQNWATQHGFYHKTQQSACWHKYYSPVGAIVNLALIVKTPHCLQDHDYTHVPYIDTLYNYFHEVSDLDNDCFLSSSDRLEFCWLNPEIVDPNSYKYSNTELQNTNGSDSNGLISAGDSDIEYCNHCECEVDRDNDDYRVSNDNNLYCLDCFDELFSSCECCGDELRRESSHTYYIENSEETICWDCLHDRSRYYYCDDCGSYFNSDVDDNFEVDGSYVCPDCFHRAGRYFTCEECGENFRERECNHDTPTQQDLCNDCYDSLISTREEEEELENAA